MTKLDSRSQYEISMAKLNSLWQQRTVKRINLAFLNKLSECEKSIVAETGKNLSFDVAELLISAMTDPIRFKCPSSRLSGQDRMMEFVSHTKVVLTLPEEWQT